MYKNSPCLFMFFFFLCKTHFSFLEGGVALSGNNYAEYFYAIIYICSFSNILLFAYNPSSDNQICISSCPWTNGTPCLEDVSKRRNKKWKSRLFIQFLKDLSLSCLFHSLHVFCQQNTLNSKILQKPNVLLTVHCCHQQEVGDLLSFI